MAHDKQMEALAAYLDENHLKHTKQRELILQAFLDTSGHVTAEDLHGLIRQDNPSVGYTTVYRTMKLLVEAGLAQERNFDGLTRYEVESEHHDHMVCTRCGKIVEFECDEIEDRQREIARQHGFRLIRHKHELYGHCKDCQ